jgi:hypothetical protein
MTKKPKKPSLKNQTSFKTPEAPSLGTSKSGINQTHFAISFRHTDKDFLPTQCEQRELKSLIQKIEKLSTFTWQAISNEPRNTYGFEFVPAKQFVNQVSAEHLKLSQDGSFMVFRFTDIGRLIGYRGEDNGVFYPVWVDRKGECYKH